MTQQHEHGPDRESGARAGSELDRSPEVDATRPTPAVSWYGPDDARRPAAPGAGGYPPPPPYDAPTEQQAYGGSGYQGPPYSDPYGQQYAGYGAGYGSGYGSPYGPEHGYGAAQAHDPAATDPSGAAFGGGTSARGRRGSRRRWVDMALAAVVAAVVAGGTTAGVLAADGGPTTTPTSSSSSSSSRAAGTGSGPVVQAKGSGSIDWGSVATAVEPSVVAISVSSQGGGGGEGSGVVLDDKGHVLTNNHVATAGGQGASLTVTLSDGRTYDATIVGTDASTDLAVLQMRGATNLTPAQLGDSSAVKVGQAVMAVGNPLGLAGTVTTGIVSALDRPVTTSGDEQTGGGEPVVTNAIQTDAAVNPGNSGGALVDTNGRVIGIPSSIASLGQSLGGSQSGSIGLGFSIPINEAKSIADQLISKGTADHPFLGVTLSDGKVQQGAATRAAAQVQDVTAGTPAAKAGIRSGDAITAVNGDQVNGVESLVAQIREKSVGDKVDLTVFRGGKEQSISVTLVARPSGR